MASLRMLKSPGLDCTTFRASAQVTAGEAPAMDRGMTSDGAAVTPRVTAAPVPGDVVVVVRAGGGTGVATDAGLAATAGDAKTFPVAEIDSGTAAGREVALGGGAACVTVFGRSVGASATTAPLVRGTAITGAGAATGMTYAEPAASFGNHLLSLRGSMWQRAVTDCNIAPTVNLAPNGVRVMLS
jgi:hypothetical protein